MKHTLALTFFLILSIGFAQNPYNYLWSEVDKLENDGLTQSALIKVELIAEKAQLENNKVQLIKTLLYESKYALILEEEGQLKIINNFKQQLVTSSIPEKNILHNLLANLYWQYFQQNRYKFYNRTHLDSKDSEDFRTWDVKTLFEEIDHHFKVSLKDADILRDIDLTTISELLIIPDNKNGYTSTLFDFLSRNALHFYKTDENSITNPAYKFEIDNPDYLCDGVTFTQMKLASKDSTSLQLQALKIYQSVLNQHLSDAAPLAFSDFDIERLKYTYQNAHFDNRDTIYLETLQNSSERWHKAKIHDVAAAYDYEIAQLFFQQGQKFNTANEENRWKLKDAITICNNIIQNAPNSLSAKNAATLKSQIKQASLQITSENYIPTQQHSRSLISYKNMPSLEFYVYKFSKNQEEKLKKIYQQDEQLKFIEKLNIHKNWAVELPNEGDYQLHSTEVVMPQLPHGMYLILAKQSDNTFAFKTIQITNIGMVKTSLNNKSIFQFIDRNNGQPLEGAKISISYRENNRESKKTESFTTDDLGCITFYQTEDSYFNINLKATYNHETAHFDGGNFYRGWPIKDSPINHEGFVFTDRSIYRPGQTVYFKSILIETKNLKSEVLTKEPVSVSLYNVNGEEVKRLELVTNAFGSVSGEFILPNSGLTGQYYIRVQSDNHKLNNASANISVEEYKRPKFETTFNPVTETFKINDSVSVKGNALAYAGSNITDAQVVYRVHRKVEYPSWYYWRRPSFYSEAQEITHGETTTNDQGEFEITFKAIPDVAAKAENLPIFHYEITADVTDINGETRSATTIVNVGYHAMVANITSNSHIDKTKKDNTLAIDTKNLNGQDVNAKGTITIYKLKAPQEVLRPRSWKAPDYQTLSQKKFKSLFPHDAYKDESNPVTWEQSEHVFKESFDTEKSKEIALGSLKKWKAGLYVIELQSLDSFGQLVKDQTRVTVFDSKNKAVLDNELFSTSLDESSYQGGDIAQLSLSSAADGMTVYVEIEKDKAIINTQKFVLNNEVKTLTIPVAKEDIGGFVVHVHFAMYNYFGYEQINVVVPYPKTDLEIETSTFRDKLQPGTDETWSFKIKGPKGEQVSAELLAIMYDASLDQFKTHIWNFNPLQKPTYYSSIRKNTGVNFGSGYFRAYVPRLYRYNYIQPNYEDWNWFGLNFTNYLQFRRDYLRRTYENKPSSYTSKKNSIIETGIIKGIVIDESGIPLPGVSIIKKGAKISTQTNFDGELSIRAKEGDNLVFSFVGYKTLTIKLSKDNYYLITLIPDFNSLEEVVVTAMGIKTKSDEITTPYQIVNSDDFYEQNSNVEEKPSGKVSEVDIATDTQTVVKSNFNDVKIRKNLQETAFFFPQLQTDAEGHVSFSFTTPEALTQWKLQLLAHTKTLESATKTLTTVTQKELMVIPNAPRFLREGDNIVISTKIANLSDKDLSGQAQLQLFDAVTGEEVDAKLSNSDNNIGFTVDAKGNTQVSWNLSISDDVQAVQYKVIAKSEEFSDGEQNALPVLSNRMLVTETLPMWIKSNETRTFTLDKLKTNTSTTLKHHKLTLEMTSNPAWYAVQALPYLMEYPYECNEQIFSRYYANALASHIANSNPRIQDVFNQWKNTDALLSNLEKNEELKSILIQETPWLRNAQSETEQKKRMALLFDMNKMTSELQSAINKLKNNQMPSGAWSWFNGGRENRWITQHIITGFGHLVQLNALENNSEESMILNAINYLDSEFIKEYNELTKYNKDSDLTKDHLSYTQLHYLYMRSFFPEIEMSNRVDEITNYYHSQIKKYWLSRPLYAKGLMALITHRMNDDTTATKILNSLKENSITNDELGMYWKENTNSWYWYQAPIETQALLIEAFAETGQVIQSGAENLETIDNLKIWLLKNKQTNQWKTTKATTEAVYALLLQGSDWLPVTDMVDVVLGGQEIEHKKLENVKVEAGTGYYKTSWKPSEIKPEMATVQLTKKGNGIAWGSLYWQYFEDIDKITSAESPLKLKKKLFLKTNTDRGEQLTEINENTGLKVGDLVRVRIELQSDRSMEFVHMKDMRAAGFEPVNVLSQFKWQDGLGYYESTKDASTNFFFDYLPKGVFVFEYDLRVNNAGIMSNGITTIQSMYAPEYSSHSEGIKIQVN